jgi:hypothetical protein
VPIIRVVTARSDRLATEVGRLLICTIAAVLLASATVNGARAGIGKVASAGKVRAWAPQFMEEGSKTRTEALSDARHFAVIAAHGNTYRGHIGAMKAANPNLRLFVYMNATATWEADRAESVYAHDLAGRRIRITGWSNTFLLDPSSPAAAKYQETRALDLLASSHYDGLFLDVLGVMPLNPTYVSALPVNPASGQVWTRSDWLRATTDLASHIRAAVAPRRIVGNGLAGGTEYFRAEAPTRVFLQSGIHGGMAESWLRSATQPLSHHAPVTVWKRDVDMLGHAGAGGVSLMTTTKLWSSGTDSQRRKWHRFALATYLLGNSGRAYFGFSFHKSDASPLSRLNRLRLGEARAPYRAVRGFYVRSFVRGRVFVNPTSGTYRVALARRYQTLGGRWVRAVTLRPYSGVILRK